MKTPKIAREADCAHCPLQSWTNALVPSTPLKSQKLIVVLDYPGVHEAWHKRPLAGQYFDLLEAAFKHYGISMDEVYITNALLCVPKYIKGQDDKIESAVKACGGRLRFVLEQFDDDTVVIAMGRWAARALGIDNADRFQAEALTGKTALAVLSIGEVVNRPDQFYKWQRGIGKALLGGRVDLPETHVQRWDDVFPEWSDLDNADAIAVDIETNTLDRNADGGEVLQIGIGVEQGKRQDYYILTDTHYDVRTWMHKFFSRYGHKIGGHNFKFDVLWLNKKFNVPMDFGWDTMLMANTLHEYWYKSLKDLATFYFDAEDYEMTLKTYLTKKFRFLRDRHYGNVPAHMLSEYLVKDLQYTLHLKRALESELKAVGRYEMPYLNYEMPLNRELCEIERGGIHVDEARRTEAAAKFQEDMASWRETIYVQSEGAIQNPNSTQQVQRYLWDDQGIPFPRMPGYKKPTTAGPVLAAIRDAHPVVESIIRFRRVSKLYGSYVKNLDDFLHGGKVYPSFKQAHVKTGRLSAEDPAIQTIPRKDARKDGDGNYGQVVKSMYIPDPGQCLVAVDGSQWELRVATALSLDPYLLKVYNDGIDFHGAMCDLLYGPGWNSAMRADEKRIMFGLLYGGTLESLVSVAELTDEQKQRVIAVFNTELTRLLAWRDEMLEIAKSKGVYVAPHYNRAFHFDLITPANERDVRKFAVNWPVQGIASMITSEAIFRCNKKLREWNARIITTVHDSIIATCPPEYKRQVALVIANALQDAGSRAFPQLPWVAEAEWGWDWGHLEPLEV